jgi:DNA adenine methylase
MKTSFQKKLSFFQYIGSKTNISKKLISLFPEHKIYVEPFGGAASVLLNKPLSKIEVLNDISDDIANLFAVVSSKDTFDKFVDLVLTLPYSRSVHSKARKLLKQPFEFEPFNPDIKRAALYFYFRNVSISGSHSFAISLVREKASVYFNKVKQLPIIHERLQNVIIEKMDFEECIRKYDTPNTLFFVDPPYFGTEYYYAGGFKPEDHERLLRTLKQIKGKFVLTTYYNDIYATELKDYYCVTIETKIYAALKRFEQREKATEYVYMNFEPPSESFAEHKSVNDKTVSGK